MPSSKQPSSTFLLLLAALTPAAHGQLSLVPEGLLDFVPESCLQTLNEVILPCAIENLCFSLLPTDEELANIPDESDVETCADIDVALCPITSRCPLCKTQADDFFKCIIFGNVADGTLSQNVTDLVAGCSLDCGTVAEEEEGSDAPVAAPVAEPLEPMSDAPSFYGVAEEEETVEEEPEPEVTADEEEEEPEEEEGGSSDDTSMEDSGSASTRTVIAMGLSAMVAAAGSL